MKHSKITMISLASFLVISVFLFIYITQFSMANNPNDVSPLDEPVSEEGNTSQISLSEPNSFSVKKYEQTQQFLASSGTFSPKISTPTEQALHNMIALGALKQTDAKVLAHTSISRIDFIESILKLFQKEKIQPNRQADAKAIISALPATINNKEREILVSSAAYGIRFLQNTPSDYQAALRRDEAAYLLFQFLQNNLDKRSGDVALSDYVRDAFALRQNPYQAEIGQTLSLGLIDLNGSQEFKAQNPVTWLEAGEYIQRLVRPQLRVKNQLLLKETLSLGESPLHSQSVVLFNNKTKSFVFEKNSQVKRSPASLTKIMTVLVALEHIPDIKAKAYISGSIRTKMLRSGAKIAGFAANERITYEDMLYATLLSSGAETAGTLAVRLAGKQSVFLDWMNAKAKELGMQDTYFKTVEGLDADGQYTTAKDMTILLEYALQNPDFYRIFTTTKYTSGRTRQHPRGIKLSSTVLSNLSPDELTDFDIIGGKSGTTQKAGLCWATLGVKSDTGYLLITMGAPLDNIYNPTMNQKEDTLYIFRNISPQAL